MKKFTTSSAILAVTFAATSFVPAIAADRHGFFLSGAVGANLPQAAKVNEEGDLAKSRYDLDPGVAVNAAAGYAFGNGVMTELELGYRHADPMSDPGADVEALSAMVNAIYELPTGGRLRPYFGAGIGVVHTDYDETQPLTGIIVNDDDTELAVQGIAGVTFQASDRVDLFLDYRFIHTGELDLRAETLENVDATNNAHIVMAGVRYHIGVTEAPEPVRKPIPLAVVEPMPPAPVAKPVVQAPPVVRSYQVLFGWDRYDLDADGRQTISAAAQSARDANVTRINVTGHADRSGGEVYNMRLSEARALSVRDALIREGVDPTAIVLRSRGEADPAIQTVDGARERRNRRVEIVLP